MRKLVLQTTVSLDGLMPGPDGELDWIFRCRDPEATAWIANVPSDAGVHIAGSRTYTDVAAYWPSSTDPVAGPMNRIPKVVFSKTWAERSANARAPTRGLEDARRAMPVERGVAF